MMARARAAGLDVVALTDHDTVAGHAEARASLPTGLTLVPGMEMSGRLDGHSVHLLGYLFDPADAALAAECARIRASRRSRARAIVDRLAGLGVPVSWEQVTAIAAGGVVGRPHIARAMAAAGVIASPADAFGPDWLGAGGRAHVTRYAPDPARAIGLIRAAGGVAVLAHPRVSARGQQERAHLGALAARLGLVASGGSDDHGELTGYRIGCDTIAPQAYERLVMQATGAAPVSKGRQAWKPA